MTDTTNIKMDFWGDVTIEKMFDIHDNDKVVICTSPADNKKPRKQGEAKKTVKKPLSTNPMTLKYYRHGNNGTLAKQRGRVDVLYKKWTEWGWIDGDTRPDDFDAFFEGEPRHCNITWTANTTILTVFLQKLLEQNYIDRQTGCSATSLVKEQFGKTPNSERKRLDKASESKIDLSLIILDINRPLPERKYHTSNDEDISDATLYEIYEGKLRSTKGI